MSSLSRLAHQAENRTGFIAGPLATYQQAHNLDDHALAELLHCPVENIVHLKLCQLPRSTHYDRDITRIAEYIQADANTLSQMLNHSTVIPYSFAKPMPAEASKLLLASVLSNQSK